MKGVRFIIWPMVILSLMLLTACAEEIEEGRRTHAISELWERIGKDPGDVDAHAQLVQWNLAEYGRTGQPAYRQAAVRQLEEVIKLRPEAHWGHCTLARIYYSQRRYDLAFFEAKEAVRLDSECPTSHETLGTLYAQGVYTDETCYDDERAELGIREFKEAVRLSPDEAYLHSQAGYLYRATGLHELAVFELREAVRLSDDADTRAGLGHALSRKGDFDAAIEEYKKALLQNPKAVNMHLYLAMVDFYSNRFDDVISEFKEYRKVSRQPLGPDFAIFQYFALRQTGVRPAAEQEIADYARSFKGQEWQAALLQYYLAKKSEAEVMAKTKNRCDRVLANYYIGYNHLAKGDKEKAREYFQKALDENVPGFSQSAGAAAMLDRLGREGKAQGTSP